MKKTLPIILLITIIASVLSACGSDIPLKMNGSTHTLYFKDSNKSKSATATFFNSDSKESLDVNMEKVSEDSDSVTFACEGDCSLYNMAYVTCNNESKDKVSAFNKFAFNACTSGWYRQENYVLPYTDGEPITYSQKFEEISLACKGGKKKIHIRKPEGYDHSSNEKYATIYVLDGQSLLFDKNEQKMKDYPGIIEQIDTMSKLTGVKAIVVAVESSIERDHEMVPELGESFDEKMHDLHSDDDYNEEFEGMNGTELSDYFADTIVPYMQENYSVYTDPAHTAISGYSLGGLACFYIAMEHPEIFGTAGCLSPSFWEYDDATWRAYLNEKRFDNKSPFIYIYAEKEPTEVGSPGPYMTVMVNRLKSLGYPQDKLVFHYDEEGLHDSVFWRNVYSEFLTCMIYQNVPPLQK